MKLTRREFLQATGAVGAASALTYYFGGRFLAPSAEAQEGPPVLEEKWVPTVCHRCPAGCGIMVRTVGGRAVKIEGNILYPINAGRICPKGQAGLQVLYDPDRVKGPMKRTNPKKGPNEDPGFVPVSWEEALDDIASRLRRLREQGLSHTVAFMGGRYRGQTHKLVRDFLLLYGSPNDLEHTSICSDASRLAHEAMDGHYDYAAYDWDNCNYLISCGAFIEAWRPTTRLLRAFGRMRRGRPNRGKIVQLDTRLSVTAAKADEWLPVLPGTDAAVVLAMAHVILTEGLWNREFVGDFIAPGRRFQAGVEVKPEDFQERWTHGLVDWWNSVVKDFTPEKAEEISGVPAGTIRRIAREFAVTAMTVGGCVASGERGGGAHTNGTYTRMCFHALNGLVGSLYTAGGIMYQVPPPYGSYPADPEDYMDGLARRVYEAHKRGKLPRIDKAGGKEFPLARSLFQNVADNHMKGDPYKLSMVFIYYTNPLFSTPSPQRFREAFKDIFIVETSSFLSETGIYADYILPDHSYLEKWLDDPIIPSLGHPAAGLRQPVVKPLYDTRNFCDVLIELGKRLGGDMGRYFEKLGSYENVLHSLARGLPGGFEQWRRKGAWFDVHYPYQFRNGKFYKNGREMSPGEVKKEVFPTRTGKFEFRSTLLEEKGYNPYPHYEPPKFAGGEEFDLYLNSPKLITHAEGRGSNNPHLMEMFDVSTQSKWEARLWIHPETARERGIGDGDEVWVESPVGRIKVRARHFPGCHPRVVVLPYEQGHFAYGRWARGRGANPNEIIANIYDPVSGQTACYDTKVRVYKA